MLLWWSSCINTWKIMFKPGSLINTWLKFQKKRGKKKLTVALLLICQRKRAILEDFCEKAQKIYFLLHSEKIGSSTCFRKKRRRSRTQMLTSYSLIIGSRYTWDRLVWFRKDSCVNFFHSNINIWHSNTRSTLLKLIYII